MRKNRLLIIAGLIVTFQILVLIGEYYLAALPLWSGTEVKLKTVPIDPRSLFRGNYALLRYDISRIPKHYLAEKRGVRKGEKIYVSLKQNSDGIFVFDHASWVKPTNGIFIKGRINNEPWQLNNNTKKYRIKYGIEAFFAPKEKALALEKQLQNGAIAIVMLTDNGKAALKNISPPINN